MCASTWKAPPTRSGLSILSAASAPNTRAVGTVMQAYLYRTEEDIRDLLEAGCRIRLCKGAYNEPPEIAFPKKSDVDANYVKLMKILLPSGVYHGIATHDPTMIEATKDFRAREQNRPRQVRVSNALRDSHRPAEATCERRL